MREEGGGGVERDGGRRGCGKKNEGGDLRRRVWEVGVLEED